VIFSLKPSRRWTASERIAMRLLEERGFKIIDLHKRIRINGVDVGEVDILAEGPNGQLYAVEVKAGKVNVQGIRQAYTNAKLLNAKPLIICKGFSDEAAAMTARELGVEVITLEDLFLVEPEELEDIVYHAVMDAVAETVKLILSPQVKIKAEYIPLLRAIAETPTIHEAAKRAAVPLDKIIEVLKYLREIAPIANRGYSFAKLAASILIIRYRLEALIARLEEIADKLEKESRCSLWVK
jgi:predicted RecB family endonuclease